MTGTERRRAIGINAMRRPFFILFISLVFMCLFLVSGCICNGSEPEDTIKTPDGGKVLSKGVEVNFESAIKEIRPEEYFDVFVKVENKGGYSVPAGKVVIDLLGDDFTTTSNRRWDNSVEMEGKGLGVDLIDTFEDIYYPGTGFPGTTLQASLKADVCYYYESTGYGHLCLKRNIYDKSDACSEKGEKLEVHMSAPLRITSVKETLFSESVVVTIKVKNTGSGTVYEPDTQCNDKKKKDFVLLKTFKLGEKNLTHTCEKEDGDRLQRLARDEQTTEFKCTIRTKTETPTETPVDIDLTSDIIREPFEIVLSYQYNDDDEVIIDVIGE